MRKRPFALLIVLFLLCLFFIPIVPYQTHYGIGGGRYFTLNSTVSVSYKFLGCGMLHGTVLTLTVLGNGSVSWSTAMPSLILTCFYRPTKLAGALY